MAQQNIDIVRGIYESFASGDVPAVLEAFSPDIVWNEADDFPYADGNPYIGPQAVLEGVFARCVQEWDDFRVEVNEVHDAGDTIIAIGHYRGRFKATGKEQNTQLVHVYYMKDGKVARFQQYANTLHTARVIGAV